MGNNSNIIKVKSNQQAFTLIELMIVVAIIGILSSVAISSYKNSLIKGRRASAQSHLLDIAQKQQQYLLDARSYAPDLATLGLTTPNDVLAYYSPITIVATAGPPPTFVVTATPKSGSDQVSDGPLSIDNNGVKTSTNKSW